MAFEMPKGMEMDLKDLKDKNLNKKYSKGIGEMLDYAAEKGKITADDAKKLKKKYCT